MTDKDAEIAALKERIDELEGLIPYDAEYLVAQFGEDAFWTEEALAWLLLREDVSLFNENGLVRLSHAMGRVNRKLGMDEWVDIPYDQIKPLYRALKADPNYGAVKWCCVYMDARPNKMFEDNMRKQGLWTDEMEALP